MNPDHGAGCGGAHCAQFIRQRGIVAADQDELGILEAFRDTAHGLRSMAAEHDDSRRPIRVEPQLQHLSARRSSMQVPVERPGG